MRLLGQDGATSGAHARRAALALLALVLHAALAGATHFHRPGRLPAPAPPGVHVGGDEDARHAADSSNHDQCVFCRLQRDLASGLRNAGPATIEPPSAAPRPAAVAPAARRGISPGVAHGRAPPHA